MSQQDLSVVEVAFAEAMVSEGKKRQSRAEQVPPRGPRVVVDHEGGESE